LVRPELGLRVFQEIPLGEHKGWEKTKRWLPKLGSNWEIGFFIRALILGNHLTPNAYLG